MGGKFLIACGASGASGSRAPPQEGLTHLLFPSPPFVKGALSSSSTRVDTCADEGVLSSTSTLTDGAWPSFLFLIPASSMLLPWWWLATRTSQQPPVFRCQPQFPAPSVPASTYSSSKVFDATAFLRFILFSQSLKQSKLKLYAEIFYSKIANYICLNFKMYLFTL